VTLLARWLRRTVDGDRGIGAERLAADTTVVLKVPAVAVTLTNWLEP
jgi:hypothetical protein